MGKNKLVWLFLAFLGMMVSTSGFCKSHEEKMQSMLNKQLEKELKQAIKAKDKTKEEAMKLEMDGYKVVPGSPSIEEQLKIAAQLQNARGNNGVKKYLHGQAKTPSDTYDGARFQAIELCKIEIARAMQSEIVGLVDNKLGNAQKNTKSGTSLVKTAAGIKDVIVAKMGQIDVVVEYYKDLPDDKVEVVLRCFYDKQQLLEQASQEIKKQLEEEGNELLDQVDEMLGLKKK